jgi:hypothetical protein
MPISVQASELLKQGRLQYGDPCYQPTWGSSKKNCEEHGNSLAALVLEHYGISYSGLPTNNWTSCCPLDILNQEPFACIKMSLSAMLIDGEYWECYADEFGTARFAKLLSGSVEAGNIRTLKNIQHCVPSIQTHSLVDMVVVRAADPPPYRQCGPWFTIVDAGGIESSTQLKDLAQVFPSENPSLFTHTANPLNQSTEGKLSSKGMKFTWGQVNGMTGPGTDRTCDQGVFSQFGSIIYPDFERKQGYKDGINDVFEIGPYQTILFWLIDLNFAGASNDDWLRNYSIQFTKSSEMPVFLDVGGAQDMSEYFGATCDLGHTGNTPNIIIDLRGATGDSAGLSCVSVNEAVKDAKSGKMSYEYSDYSIPRFFGYGRARSKINFNDISKWDLGANVCYSEQVDNMYEATQTLLANGSILDHWWGFPMVQAPTMVNLGVQKERRTFDLAHSSTWMEIPIETDKAPGDISYALRSEAPSKATYCEQDAYGLRQWGWGQGESMGKVCFGSNIEWHNGLWYHMMEWVDNSFPAGTPGWSMQADSLRRQTKFNPGGYLFGMDDGLYVMNEFWAKVTVSRPGIVVQGKGKDAGTFLNSIVMRAMPVYTIDFPAPVAAAGRTGFNQAVDPATDIFDSMYCTVEEDIRTKSDSEKLQEAMTGATLEISLPMYYPEFTPTGNMGTDYKDVGKKCYDVAKNIFGYLDSYRNVPNKSMTYICGPPETQADVPQLGERVQTPYGARTINSITFQYSDKSSYAMTIDVGPVSISQSSGGKPYLRHTKTEEVKGRISSHVYGALYKVRVQGIGVVQAWNADHFPWEVGDMVNVQLYNHPLEL